MRISDWSSDVCSSDLLRLGQAVSRVQQFGLAAAFAGVALVALGQGDGAGDLAQTTLTGVALVLLSAVTIAFYYVWSVELEIGRASCRERVCQYVEISVGPVSLKQKMTDS